MSHPDPLVSTIVPTYNRARDVVVAIDSALAQTYPAARQEILVVDDGSTDDTPAVLARYGDKIRVLRKPNGGVSAARNHGMAHARGELYAFLDSDDDWRPEKLRLQVEFLRLRPDYGMVLTDILRVDGERQPIEEYRRRTVLPEDGMILRHVLKNPALAPSTALVRKAVVDEVGGFDPSLRTAEDIDFHLRVAARWPIGLIAETLTRCMREHEGLSKRLDTYDDYMRVMTSFVTRYGDNVAAADRHAALMSAYLRNARGLILCGAYPKGISFAARGLTSVRNPLDLLAFGRLGVLLARNAAGRALRKVIPKVS